MMALQRPMHLPTNQDMSEIDRFINYDQAAIPSPSNSPSSHSSKSSVMPVTPHDFSSSLVISAQPGSQQTFAAPSHQYAAYPQNNGLPTGALLDSLPGYRANQLSASYSHKYHDVGLWDNVDLTPTDELDYGGGSYYTGSNNDMDIDFNTPPQSGAKLATDAGFIEPSAIDLQESSEPTPQPQVPKRAYPGMHQQQAAAKAQAEAQQQKQREASARQQHSAAVSQGRTVRSPADPVVEDRISRLLNEMRHNSVASTKSDDTVTQDQGTSQHTRAKKEEEDMDEDERLLASEEGKKLSSKERRQLRNKVSARAFRSRRKEYITQLEGEIAAKTAEADDLRNENHKLKQENANLLALTKNILESPAMAEYITQTGTLPGTTASPETEPLTTLKPELHELDVPKDANPNQVLNQQNTQQEQDTPYIGMTMIPEHPVDFSVYNTNVNAWGGNIDLGLYNTPQVFAVTSVPQGPSIDELRLANLSEKPSDNIFSHMAIPESKDEVLSYERMPSTQPIETRNETVDLLEDENFDESDPVFILYTDSPAPLDSSFKAQEPIFGHIELEKAFGRVELLLEEQEDSRDMVSSAAVQTFERLCSSLDEISERVFAKLPQ